jgi:hypothetical protein
MAGESRKVARVAGSFRNGAAKESNLPRGGLLRTAGFEDRMRMGLWAPPGPFPRLFAWQLAERLKGLGAVGVELATHHLASRYSNRCRKGPSKLPPLPVPRCVPLTNAHRGCGDVGPASCTERASRSVAPDSRTRRATSIRDAVFDALAVLGETRLPELRRQPRREAATDLTRLVPDGSHPSSSGRGHAARPADVERGRARRGRLGGSLKCRLCRARTAQACALGYPVTAGTSSVTTSSYPAASMAWSLAMSSANQAATPADSSAVRTVSTDTRTCRICFPDCCDRLLATSSKVSASGPVSV